MSEEPGNDEVQLVVHEMLRAIRRNQTAILTKLDNISEETRTMEVRFGALETRFSAMEERMAGVEVRLDRLVIPRM
ncbi:hypothetical protein GGQ85_000878 [Nitrobacter vulgaris]|uniref:hypothetical protein n=1 Tax=Nitrobacter vulgaris TaxID=29421 RepID=UPI0028557AFE|nr:hypothetical protein [Nitrobacter vulgaris]MDR6303197.1 hypothetical protein [Nitrobacter vulgaris]